MNITVKIVDLARELNFIEKIVAKKPTIPVLTNVLIQANMGGLVLSATDLEIGLIGACAAVVVESGAVTLPAKKLMELVRAQSAPDVVITSDAKGVVKIQSGKFLSRLQAMPAADFPGIPHMPSENLFIIPREPMRDMLKQVRFAISDTEKSYFMRGAYLASKDGKMVLAATDARRLSVTRYAHTDNLDATLISVKALDELFLLLGEPGDGDITFAKSERHLFFDLDGRLLIARQIDGKFPNFERIIPKGNDNVATVDRVEFATVLKRLILISDVVVLVLSNGTLKASSSSNEIGDGVELVEANYTGPTLEVRYNGQFLIDYLDAATSETITFALKDATQALLMSDGEFINVVMGMKG